MTRFIFTGIIVLSLIAVFKSPLGCLGAVLSGFALALVGRLALGGLRLLEAILGALAESFAPGAGRDEPGD